MLFLERLPLEPLTDDNSTSGQSWNRHLTLEVDQISHQSLAVGNGSLLLVCLIPALSAIPTTLSFRKAPIDKVPVLRVHHQKMRIEQYFLMTDYSLWEVILNGDSPVPTRLVEGVAQPVAPTTVEQNLARKNELKARGTLLI
nr:hypothetical protein [Tanacetum cinerariifolium]